MMLQKDAGPGVIAGAVAAVLLVVGLLAWVFLKPQDPTLNSQEQQAVDQGVESQYKAYFPGGGAPGQPPGGGGPGGPMGGMPGGAPGGPMGGMPGAPPGGAPGGMPGAGGQ